MDLSIYRRDFRPDLEAAPQDPVEAVNLTAHGGTPFTLVREAPHRDHVGWMMSWFAWVEGRPVGYLACNIVGPPFDGIPLLRRPALGRYVRVWRAFVTDGTRPDFIDRDMRRQRIAHAAGVDIVRQCSERGFGFCVNRSAMNKASRRVWDLVLSTRGFVEGRNAALRCSFVYTLAAR